MINENENTGLDPNENVRSDLWPTMTQTELSRQYELMHDRLAALSSIANMNPSVGSMIQAVHHGLTQLQYFIDNYSTIHSKDKN